MPTTEDEPSSPILADTLLEDTAAPVRGGRPWTMRRIVVGVLVLMIVQLAARFYVFDVDVAQVHHAVRSWHKHIFGDSTSASHFISSYDPFSWISAIAGSGGASSFVRAAVLYLPSHEPEFEIEFRWFRRSWLEMQKAEPSTWRTDIVVYSDGNSPALEALNCSATSRRTSRDDANMCILHPTYTSVYSDAFPYEFADSVNVVGLNGTDLDMYDWVLRTDVDTFLTPAFATWRPPKMVVGEGSYLGLGFTTGDRLASITSSLNLTTMNLDNVGSTWYGPTSLVRTCANLSMSVMQYLYANEFTDEEKSPEYGIKGWPQWHIGVVSMYAGHIAINHCTRDVGVAKDEDMLDFPTTSSDPPSRHAHLHTWQDNDRFSKGAFIRGAYAHEDRSKLRPAHTIVDYAMYMALDSQPTALHPRALT
ncbi:hypothetical protein DYB26_001113 [Aphanomyces astaci]|uniref:DUF7164 domain-containing protein n=1 Tax=Aphanomyces astaci TaxID=112090 RepID=A0A397EFI0_APHAT|nr:hypothetical protein DYB31_000500 [Aphanomyces astaci]RHZ39457.1 hypothetical protein DYB26_001113 [Aphanomyces astaci]